MEQQVRDIKLNEVQTADFLRNLSMPPKEMIEKREAFLEGTSDFKWTKISETGFNVDIPDLDLTFIEELQEYNEQIVIKNCNIKIETDISYISNISDIKVSDIVFQDFHFDSFFMEESNEYQYKCEESSEVQKYIILHESIAKVA